MVSRVHGGLEKGSVIQQGTYVAMIASAEYQSEIEEAFNAQFAK